MRLSAKGRYGLAAMIALARDNSDQHYIPVITIADNLGLSKIYLEQIFSLLKRAGLLRSIKGPQGGYCLSKAASAINAYDILEALDPALFEPAESSVHTHDPLIESVMQADVFSVLDDAVYRSLSSITLEQLAKNASSAPEHFMFFI